MRTLTPPCTRCSVTGLPTSQPGPGEAGEAGKAAPAKPAAAAAPADDEAAMKDIMMTRKVKRVYQRVTREQAAKKARVEELERRAEGAKRTRR